MDRLFKRRRSSVVGRGVSGSVVVIAISLAASLAGCGQKGPLIGPKPVGVPPDSGASAVPPPIVVKPPR